MDQFWQLFFRIESFYYIYDISQEVTDLCLDIWANPEISGQERQQANKFRQVLKKHGFQIKEIPGLSQKVDAKQKPVEENTPGHGCGHNLLGSAALGAPQQ